MTSTDATTAPCDFEPGHAPVGVAADAYGDRQELLVAAMNIARGGWRVFPCNPVNKYPLTEHGFKDATSDLDKVLALWRQHPGAMIGVETGAGAGFFVVDIDAGTDEETGEIFDAADLRAALEEKIGEQLPKTREAETPRGGRHLYFRMPADIPIRNRAGVVHRIDVRGTGGYIISPPSRRADGRDYRIAVDAEIAAAPDSLVRLITEKSKKTESAIVGGNAEPHRPGAIVGRFVDERRQKYALTVLHNEAAAVRNAPRGTRNDQLNISAVKVGHFVGSGDLSEYFARNTLRDAAAPLAAEDGQASVDATITSGLTKGISEPADMSNIGTGGYRPAPASTPAAAVRGTIAFDDGTLYDPWAEYDAPAFPLDLLPGPMRTFVEAKAVETGADISAVAMAALAVASASLTHEATLYLKPGKNFPVSGRLWVLLVGPPSAKKSPAQSGAVAPLLKHQRATFGAWSARKAQAAKDAVDFDESEPPQLVANDTTPEKMADILSRQDRGILCFHDELSGFIGALDRYGSGKGPTADRAFWLKAYDGGHYHIQRVGRPTVPISNLSASFLGGIQPGRLRELSGLSSDGLLQRFLPVMMRKPRIDSDYFNAAAREDWEGFIDGLLGFGAFSTELTPEARQVRSAIRESLFTGSQTESEGEAFQGFVGKLDGVWGNLALLLHVLWGGKAASPVSAQTAGMASKVIEDFILPHGLAFYRSVVGGGQEDHKAIGAFLVRFEGDVVKVRDLSRGPGCFRGLAAEEISKRIGPFVAGGWLEAVEVGPGNTSWRVNPSVRTDFAKTANRHAEWVRSLQEKIKGRRVEE